MKHYFEVKVYHADTDCYGVVWHGSYLRFMEQARCEFSLCSSLNMKYFEEKGIYFPLVEANIKYKHSAKVHDTLIIETTIEKLTLLRTVMLQKIINKDTKQEIAEGLVTFVCTDTNGKLVRKMPDELFNALKNMQDA